MSTVAVDWDNTLYTAEQGWLPDAKRALKVLKRRGHKVVVHSSRAQYDGGRQFIRAALREAGYPDLEVTAEKIDADVYVDDKGLRFEGDWADTLRRLRQYV
jgi:predicted mannosyl-3-phosphoglycerate phosphatase (HAD superfamily)